MRCIRYFGLLAIFGFGSLPGRSHVISHPAHHHVLDSRNDDDIKHMVVSPETPFLADLTTHLAKTKYHSKKWQPGLLPRACRDNLIEGQRSIDVDVFDVFYEDCDRPWVLCRHTNAQLSAKELADNVGKIPIGLRSFVRHFIALPDNQNVTHGLNDNDNVVLYGTVHHMTVFIHEVSPAPIISLAICVLLNNNRMLTGWIGCPQLGLSRGGQGPKVPL